MNEAERAGFWSRWSRRKREGDEVEGPEPGESPDAMAPATDQPPTAPARPACPIPNLPAIDLASLPPIEALTPESDFSLFLRPGVPAALRGAALRRMWSLDPSIRDFIETADYQWDFNSPGGLPPGFADELVGEARKLLAQAIGKAEGEEGAADPAASPPAPDADAPIALAEASPSSEHSEDAAPAPYSPPDAPPADGLPPTRRRHGSALPG